MPASRSGATPLLIITETIFSLDSNAGACGLPCCDSLVGPDPQTGGLFVASAWGGSAQWLRNLEVCPKL